MNIVLPLGTGSRWQDNELRYCLRSIEKHLKGWEQIIIVGVLPGWLKPNDRLIFIPVKDFPSETRKEENIHLKTMAAINAGVTGERFLFMNDDHFLLQDVEIDQFPYHHKGPLVETLATTSRFNSYRKTMVNTANVCRRNQFNYDTHCPIIYQAETYQKKIDAFVFPPYGFCIKTLYCYYANIEGEYYTDLKIKEKAGFDEAVKGRMYFSTGNACIGPELECFMEKIYPERSMFE